MIYDMSEGRYCLMDQDKYVLPIEFKSYLQKALDDKDIQDKLIGILAKPERDQGQAAASEGELVQAIEQKNKILTNHLNETEKKNAELRQQLEAERQKRGLLDKQLKTERQNLALLEERLKAERQNLVQQEERLHRSEEMSRPFRELLEHYASYRSLPETVLSLLSRLLWADDPVRFLVSGCQIKSLLNMWDAVKDQLDDLKSEQMVVMTDILSFFIKQYNSIWDDPIYELMTDEAGAPFDQQRHIRGSGCSSYQGNIQEILLPGIWNRNRKVVERKCVVRF